MHDRDIQLILLSALQPRSLVLVARQLLEHLQSRPELKLADIAYTLQVGREAMPHRLALLAASREQLLDALQCYVENPEAPLPHGFRGASQSVEEWGLERARSATPQALARAWADGAVLRWRELAAGGPGRRVSLPGYPFERERHWAEDAAPAAQPSSIFSLRLNGDEFFLLDHQLGGRPILPGMMYPELMSRALRAAGHAATPFQLEGLAWLQPLWGDSGTLELEVSLQTRDSQRVLLEVSALDPAGQRQVHCQARLGAPERQAPHLDVAALQRRASRELSGDECYPALASLGLAYGPGHQCMRRLWIGDFGVLVKLEAPADTWPAPADFLIHPGLFDSALQAALGFHLEHQGEGQAALPFALERLTLLCAPPASLWGWLRPQAPGAMSLDIDLFDEQGGAVALFRGLASRPAPVAPPASSLSTDGGGEVTDDVRQAALSYMRGLFAITLRLDAAEIDEAAQLEQYGIDSIIIIRLTDELEKVFGPLSKTLFFEYQTLGDITDYFLAQHDQTLWPLIQAKPQDALEPAPKNRPFPAPPPPHVDDDEEIAIIGLAGRYPGARNMREFWQCLADGRDMISGIPAERWDHSRFFDPAKNTIGKTYCKHGGFIDDVDKFDPLFFGISPREAIGMEPQERLFLECAYETLQDAGYTRDGLPTAPGEGKGRDVGVFVGVMYQEYQLFGAQSTERGYPFAVPGHPASIANRVSYVFNLQGPSIALDTMCSSSLTTLHLACRSIRADECSMALAGGVNVSIHPNKYLMLGQGGFASAKGRCESFGEGGEGYVPGEGVGAALLKRKSQAIADGDHIYGVIKASALNHGGKTNGYTVPNPLAQAEVIAAALEQAGAPARAVSYIEAHGTGTSLGDPIEIAGLSRAFARHTQDTQFCAIGSVKSNIGHCESAAGIAGVSKVLLQLKHGQLAPSLHAETLNPNIDFDAGPFYVQRSLAPWPSAQGGAGRDRPRLAGISSFGAGGANAHLLIEEYVAAADVPAASRSGPAAIVLSAKTADALRQSAQRLAEALEDTALREDDLARIAFTLQLGREAMSERLALAVDSLRELRTRLAAYLAGDLAGAGVLEGSARGGEARAAVVPRDADAAIRAWVAGQQVDWLAAHELPYPRKISLPTYPFARERYWVEDEAAAAMAAQGGPASLSSTVLHPLVQSNTSRIGLQRFSSRFDGTEFFFADHRINGEKLLPAAASIEMFVAAAGLSLRGDAPDALRLSRLAWLQPIVHSGADRRVDIEILAGEDGALQLRCMDPEAAERVFSQARASDCERRERRLELEALMAGSRRHLDGAQLYQRYREAGYEYGPSFQSIAVLWCHEDYAVAKLQLEAADHAKRFTPFRLPPALLDGALQACAGLLCSHVDNGVAVALPFAIDRLEVYARCEQTMWAVARRQPASSEAIDQFDIDLCDSQGRVCVAIEGFSSLRPKSSPQAPRGQADVKGEQKIYLTPQWTPAPAEPMLTAVDSGTVLVLGCDADELKRMADGHPLANALRIAADSSVAQLAELLGEREFRRLVWLAPGEPLSVFDQAAVLRAQEAGTMQLFRLIKALLQQPQGGAALELTVVQFESCDFAGQAAGFAQAGVHGLAGALAKEAPRWRVRSVDIERGGAASLDDILRQPIDDLGLQRVHRAGRWYVKQWLKTEFETPEPDDYLRRDGTYVVIGGAGGLGGAWSEHAIRQHNAQVVWLGRRPLDATIQRQIDAAAEWGRTPAYYQADACDLASLQGCLRQVRERFGAVHGVIHSALSLDDRALANMDEASMRQVYFAKLRSSLNLGIALREAAPDFLLFFSSSVVLTPPAGQANYSAGCLFQNALARQLAQELPSRVKVIDWGYWGNTGVAASPRYRDMMARNGIASIEPEDGMEALRRLFGHDLAELALLKVNERASNPPQLIPSDEQVTVRAGNAMTRHALRQVAASVVSIAGQAPIAAVAAAQATGPADDDRLQDAGLLYFKRLIAEELRIPIERLNVDAPLDGYGIDSIYSVRLVATLSQSFSDISNTLFFEVQNIRGLVKHFMLNHRVELSALLGLAAPQSVLPANPPPLAAVPPSQSAPPRDGGGCDIAVIGLSGRYAQADDLDEFWQNLLNERNCIGEIPRERWDWRRHFDPRRGTWGKHYSKWGGFIRDIAAFDPLFFQISPTEAERMDPQARLFLEQAHACIEDAGYTPTILSGGHRVGVFVGAMNADYVNGASYWSIANRVSYLFDFKGPSLAVDTACSSSLSAIHLAIDSLISGSCDSAIAGGVNLIMNPAHYMSLSLMGMLSDSDQCRAFGADADGFVDGEGVGALLLKPLAAAVADGDHIYGVIKGSALNAGGRTSGFTVPNPVAQAEVVSEALRRSGIAPRHIGYIEAHGTGTPLGDPIEIKGLTEAFGGTESERQYCAIGSVKSNIGHCESAAGIAGVTKVLLQFQHATLLPSLHCERSNPRIDFARTPFRLQLRAEPWAPGFEQVDGKTSPVPRSAGVSSFGAGGANAHLILQEYQAPELSRPPESGIALILLSAQSAGQLRQRAERLLARLEADGGRLDLRDIAYTLQVGREAMEHRLAFCAASLAQLQEILQAFVDGRADEASGCHQGVVDEHRGAISLLQDDEDLKSAVELWFSKGKFNKLLALWVKGLQVDWQHLQGAGGARRVSLPSYPFAREFFWLDLGGQASAGPGVLTPAPFAALHPLLQENHSRLDRVRYSGHFDGGESILRDHLVNNRPLLPAAAQVEMLRCAAVAAVGQGAAQPVRLRDLAWIAPIDGSQPLALTLYLERGVNEQLQLRLVQGNVVHCQCSAEFPPASEATALDLDALRAGYEQVVLSPDEFYRRMAGHALEYGPSLRTLSWAGRLDDSVLVFLRADPQTYADSRYVIDPGLLDGVLQALALFDAEADAPTLALPFAVQSIDVFAPCRGSVWALLRRQSAFNALGLKTDVDVYDEAGRLCLSLRGLVTRGLVAKATPTDEDDALIVLSPRWVPANL